MRKARQVALILIALGVAAGMTGCGSEAAAEQVAKKDAVDPVGVEVAAVTQGTLTPGYPTTAKLESERDAVLVAESPGEVLTILVEEGDRVQKGQVLARLESDRERLERDRVKAEANRTEQEAARGETLTQRGLLSRQAAEQTAAARASQRAVLGLAQLKLSKTEIRAPYAGVITSRHIKQGQWLAAGEAAFGIADFNALQARVSVPERAAAQLRPGQAVEFVADAIPGARFAGHVARISPVVDRSTGTVGATIALDDKDARLRPGLFVRLQVSYEQVADAVLVPKSAIVRADSGETVYVVAEGKVAQRPVKLGLEQGESVQALAGVNPGETVVTVGQDRVANGDQVLVLNQSGTTAGTGRAAG